MKCVKCCYVFIIILVLLISGSSVISSVTSIYDTIIDPSYLTTAAFSNWIPDGGGQVFIVFPKVPIGKESNSTWTGLARPNFVVESTIESYYIEDISTGLPTEMIPLSAEMGIGLIRASGDGYFSITAEDNFGELKPSMPLVFEVIPSGDHAVKWDIVGPKLMNFSSDFSIHWAVAVDAGGYPVPLSFPGIVSSVVRVKIVGESMPDSSARVASAFERVPDFEVSPMGYYGTFPFMITDNQAETVMVVAEALAGTLANSDTFEVIFQPDDEPANVIVMSSNGIRIPQNSYAGLIAMSFYSGMPDPVNYSTKVRLEAIDISGSASATISPFVWQTMIGGAAGFTFYDTEADTDCVFISADIDSFPRLETPIIIPLQVVPDNWAISLDIDCPAVAFVDETIRVAVSAVDSRGEIDPEYIGYFALEVWAEMDGSITMIDSITGESWPIHGVFQLSLPLEEGKRTVLLTSSDEDNVHFSAIDAEPTGYFDMGLLNNSPEKAISFESFATTSAVRYSFIYPGDEYFSAGEELDITVTARNGSGNIDSSYSGVVSIDATGSAITDPPDGLVTFSSGIASLTLIDSFTEDVSLIASGPLYSDTLRLRFIRTGDGGVMAYSQDYTWIPIGAERNIRMVIFNKTFIETRYNGSASVSIFDSDADSSVSSPDSIYFSSGLGFITVSNSDAEQFTIYFDGDEDIGSISVPLESRAEVAFDLPPVTQVSAALDTINFELIDFAGGHYASAGTIFVEAIEEIENMSVTFDSTVVFEDGRAIFTLEDSEPESVWIQVRIPDGQLLYMDAEETGEWEYNIAGLDYVTCNINEAELPRELSLMAYPNPFNSAIRISIDYPMGVAFSPIKVEIFNISGRRIAKLTDSGTEGSKYASAKPDVTKGDVSVAPKAHEFTWCPEEPICSGIYLIRAVLPNGSALTRKAVYLK